jgi:omega-amidase
MNLSVALAQLQVTTGNFKANTSRAMEFIDRAVSAKADLIVFPELWTAGFDYSNLHFYAQLNTDYLADLQIMANDRGIAVGGSYIVEDEQKYYNQFVLIQPGLPPLTYRKIHLFHLMEEDTFLSPGSQVSFFQTRWGPVSLSVCYDLRFPEMYRLSREKGANLVLITAGWPLKRIEHWKVLLRARAIENQTFVAAVNCVDGDARAPFGGASAIIGPWGDVLQEAGTQGESLLLANLDLNESAKVRKQYPFFDDRQTTYSTQEK